MSDKEKEIPVTRSSLPPYEEFIEAVKPIWDSAWLTNMGEFHQQLEEELKTYLDVEQLTLFTNGHLGLEMALQAMDLTGEVITTPFSFASTTHAIIRNGLTPVFCDIDPATCCIDAEKIEALITEKTSAILPVHVYGHICNVEKIGQIAAKHHLKVIYDAAHTFGETLNGVGIGRFGDAAMFSFHATKVFHTMEGGGVSYRDGRMKERLDCLKNFGIINQEQVVAVGGNAKMNEFQAVMGLCNLKHLPAELEKRKQVVNRYRERLAGVKGIRLPGQQPGVKSNYAYFPVLCGDDFALTRNELYDWLAGRSIYARKYFYPLIPDFECYREQFGQADLPAARYVAERVLTLPCYASLAEADVDRICNAILEARR